MKKNSLWSLDLFRNSICLLNMRFWDGIQLFSPCHIHKGASSARKCSFEENPMALNLPPKPSIFSGKTIFGRSLFVFFSFLLFLTACETKSVIVYNVSGRDANEIVVLLASKGIPSTKSPAPAATAGGTPTEQMWDISVPGEYTTEAIAALNQAGLPRVKGTTLLDLFGTTGLVPSDLQDRIRYQEGLSDQLSNTIRKMDGVLDADVQISFPHTEEEQKKELSASVYIKHGGVMDNPNSLLITRIKRLVSSAVPGLSIENVTVIADRALYSDVQYPGATEGMEKVELVSIWGVEISAKSVFRFRAVFYSFFLGIFLLIGVICWMFWKFHLVIEKQGAKWFFTIPPYKQDGEKEEKKEEAGG